VAALLALQPHGDYAVISVRVCMAKRAKRVAGCAAGSLVGQALLRHQSVVIVTLTVLGEIALKDGGLGRFAKKSFTIEHIKTQGKYTSA